MAARKKGLHGLVKDLSHSFGLYADPTVARGQKAYMRHQFVFHGLQSPLRRRVQKEVFAKHALTDHEELSVVLKQLWGMEEREYQVAAIDLAEQYKKLWREGTYLKFSKSPTVDLVASKLVGGLILRFPDLAEHMDKWIDDDFMWARRTAIIHQLSYKGKTDEAKLFDFCKRRAHEDEFFIRKAIGWALRQHARVEPDSVRKFIQDNSTILSALSIKEASKHL